MAVRRSTTSRSTSPRKGSGPRTSDQGRRVRVVWISFLGAMTLTGGLLLLLDGRPVPRIDGLSLSPLAAATGVGSGVADPVFQTRRPLDRQRWQAIVIHHSGSTAGSPATIEREHEARSFKGLGHHFIVGNGSGMDDGQLHLGYRWLDQLPGAHAAGTSGDWFNQHAVSICLVGDGNRRAFSAAQIERLRTLVAALQAQLQIPAERVYLHSDIAPVSDPGRLFPAGLIQSPVR
jgi:hypothetical protein